MSPRLPEMQTTTERSRKAIISARIAKAIATITSVLALIAIALLAMALETPQLPPLVTEGLTERSRYLVDVVVYDRPSVGAEFVNDAVRPMIMVLRKHWPGRPQHLRIALYRNGFPISYRLPASVMGGYLPRDRFFMFDLAAIEVLRHPDVPLDAWVAFATAHEATHLWQHLRGATMGDGHFNDPQGYTRDPLEIEAFQQGVNFGVEIALAKGVIFNYEFSNGAHFEPEAVFAEKVERGIDYDLNISGSWTIRGTLLRWRDEVKSVLSHFAG